MKKILVVDDSFSWQNFHKKLLEDISAGYDIEMEIKVASSGKDGYDMVLQNNNTPFDLIISDLQMEDDFSPKYAGEWFVEQVKTFKNYFNTKIIICSGSYNIKQIAENLSVDYIPKRVAVNDVNVYDEVVLSYLK